MKPLLGAVAALALLAPLPALAHHGWAGQDNAHVTNLEGRIAAVRYHNPHGEIDLVQGDRKWTVTLAPITRMDARGLSEAAFKIGDTVKVSGHRNLDMSRYEVKANSITMGGKTTELR
jgi:hypothetical protein